MLIKEYSYESDKVSNIDQIIFGILSPKRIVQMGATEVYRHITGNHKDQPGTQSDIRLGVVDRNKICQTCLQDCNDCPGHMGYIHLAKPVFQPQFFPTVLKILSMICFRCSRLRLDFSISPNKEKVAKISKKNQRVRFNLIRAMITDIKKCPHCDAYLPHKIVRDVPYLSKIKVSYPDPGKKTEQEIVRKINPELVLAILKAMTEEDITLLGFDTKYAKPEWMIWTVMPFPPITVRPQIKLDIGRQGDDDLTIKLNEISRFNNIIKLKLQAIKQATDGETIKSTISQIDNIWEWLQFHVITYINNESNKTGKTAIHRSGRPLKSLVQRIKAKEGRVRGNLMGKRVNHSGRTVVTPDNNIKLDEIGVPKKIAVNLTIPEIVTPYNISYLQQMVYNGQDVYPGAKYCAFKGRSTKKTLKPMPPEQRREIKLVIGDVVYRNLVDGDWALVNRQPSLHRMSMMGHKILVIPGETFRLNVQSVTPYNADFDGDEMNIHIPQNIESINELARLMHLATQIISPKHALPIMGLVQDNLLGLYMFAKFAFLSCKNTMKMMSDLMLLAEPIYYDLKDGNLIYPSYNVLNAVFPKITIPAVSPSDPDIIRYGKLYKKDHRNPVINPSSLKPNNPGLFQVVWYDYGPQVTKNLFDNLARIATNWLLISGFSVGILDCLPNEYISEKIQSIVLMHETATQYLVDYRQLNSLPVMLTRRDQSLKLPCKDFREIVHNCVTEIRDNGYTFSNRNRVEEMLAQVYYYTIINRLIIEIDRIAKFDFDEDNIEIAQDTMINRGKINNHRLVSEQYKSLIENDILGKFDFKTTAKMQDLAKLYGNLNEIISSMATGKGAFASEGMTDLHTEVMELAAVVKNYSKEKQSEMIKTIKTSGKWRGLRKSTIENIASGDALPDLINSIIDQIYEIPNKTKRQLEKLDGVVLLNEDDLIEIEAFLKFSTTLIYIIPGSADINERVEIKMYELIQGATSIVNDQLIDNIRYYRYRGLDGNFLDGTGEGYGENSFKMMAIAKSKGDKGKIGQIGGLLGQQDLNGKRQDDYFYRRALPHFVRDSIEPKARGYVQNSYLKGLNMIEYFAHAQAGRLGQIDKTIKSVTPETEIVIIEDGKPIHTTIGEWIDAKLAYNASRVEHYAEQEMELLQLTDKKVFIPTANEYGNVTWGAVTAVTRHDPGLQLYEIKTSGGRNVIVTESKSLLIWNKHSKKFVHTSTPNVVVGDYVPVTASLAEPPFIAQYIEMPDYTLEPKQFLLNKDNGQFVGLFLAQGNVDTDDNSVRIEITDANILNFVQTWFNGMGISNEKVVSLDNHSTFVRGHSEPFAKFLTRLVGSSNSHIPDESIIASKDFITGLLGGYLSGNATVTKDSIEVKFRSERLIQGLSMLCSRLGVFCEISKSTSTLIPTYNLSISAQWATLLSQQVNLINFSKNETQTQAQTQSSTKFHTQNNVVLDQIVEINLVDVAKYPKVYDLTVPSTVNFGLANGLHVVDTAETGYEQRKLIKLMEGLVVQYDQSVRNTANNVIQKVYGSDAIDPQQLEKIPLNFKDFKESLYFTKADFQLLKSRLAPNLVRTIESDKNYLKKLNKQYYYHTLDYLTLLSMYPSSKTTAEKILEVLNQTLPDELRTIPYSEHTKYMEDRDDDLFAQNATDAEEHEKYTRIKTLDPKSIINKDKGTYMFIPVNFNRIIKNNHYRFKLDELPEDSKSDLDPLKIYSKIREILKNLTHSIALNAHYHLFFFRVAINMFMNPKYLIMENRYNEQTFNTMIEDIYLKYSKSVVAPGESIGIVSAQSIGEILTQMTLNQFHAAGVGKAKSKLNSGVPRLKEILGLTGKDKLATPSMVMEVSEHALELNKDINIDVGIIGQTKAFKLRGMVISSSIHYDPKGKKDLKVHLMNNLGKDMMHSDPEAGVSHLLPWLLELEIDPIVKRDIRTDTIHFAIEKKMSTHKKKKSLSSAGDYRVVMTYDGQLDPDTDELMCILQVRCNSMFLTERNDSTDNMDILSRLRELEAEVWSVNIKGFVGISDVFVEKEATGRMITTIGSDVRNIISSPIIGSFANTDSLISNNLLEVQEIYGIEAARNAFIQEIYSTLKSDISIRHIELLGDNMTHLGVLLGVSRHGSNKGNTSPLHRASFEETTTQFVNSSMFADIDHMVGPSANVMFGQCIKSGTNAFEIMIDHEKLEILEPIKSELSIKYSINPFSSKCQEIEIPLASSVMVLNLNLNDIFIYQW